MCVCVRVRVCRGNGEKNAKGFTFGVMGTQGYGVSLPAGFLLLPLCEPQQKKMARCVCTNLDEQRLEVAVESDTTPLSLIHFSEVCTSLIPDSSLGSDTTLNRRDSIVTAVSPRQIS